MSAPGPVSILLVDDQPNNLLALEAALASDGHTLVQARSGPDALRCLLTQDFAVILLDIQMSGMDGFETARLIRARRRSDSTPIILLTAYDRDGARTKDGYRVGAIDYIYKPYDPYVLRSKVAFFVELFRKTVALTTMAAELAHREQQVVALNAQLEKRVSERTAALDATNSLLAAESNERVRAQKTLRALQRGARAEAEMAAGQALVLAEVSRVLVEDFMNNGPMLGRVAHIVTLGTQAACLIQLMAADGVGLVPLAVDHVDHALRTELARAVSAPQHDAGSTWQTLDAAVLHVYPLVDSVSAPMLARTTMMGVLSLGRFGADAARFTDSERRLCEELATRVALAVENVRLYESARVAIELRDKFLTVAAHELKTPMTSIQGYSQLLSRQLDAGIGQDAAPVRRAAHMIEDRTRHLGRLVEQILDVSRLVASRMELSWGDADLAEMITTVVAEFERRFASHEFRLHLQPGRVQAVVDAMRLEQVMANLIDNAVRYSPNGGAIDITVEDRQQDKCVTLSVRDRGLGIPEEHRAHIFDRFHQAHAVAYRSGMGLGLHISREIVLLHGGTITVAFPADGGSEFTVQLPRRVKAPAQAPC